MSHSNYQYRTLGGVSITRTTSPASYERGVQSLAEELDTRCGVILASGFEFPGRYSRNDIGFVDPPLQIVSRDRQFSIRSLNSRGRVLLLALEPTLENHDDIIVQSIASDTIDGFVKEASPVECEEQRSRQVTIFSVLRACQDVFASSEDPHLGFYGAFAYDLCFQFEPIEKHLPRAADHRDIVLFMPDEIIRVDHANRQAWVHRYDFTFGSMTTEGLPRTATPSPLHFGDADAPVQSDHGPGEYANAVEKARDAFRQGDLFEAVLSQTFTQPLAVAPSVVFKRLSATNPSPYGAFMNLGDGEALVASSPEMFVRVEGNRVETCPISGTVARGKNALEDAENVRKLLNSEKDAAELTMCTDVDRNDKSRICVPGSVKVIGRRQLEFYSRLIHTVDHVEGYLRPEFDAVDAFLSHMWAVTVTGAPKAWATGFVEQTEKTARRWYGGAIGRLTFNGDLNTGLTIRTTRLKDGYAEVRVGATLLYDSYPPAEDDECRLKASALFSAINASDEHTAKRDQDAPLEQKQVLLVDHQDSFVHTLGDYFRQLGASVTTLRPAAAQAQIEGGEGIDLLVLSPGPGRPSDFDTHKTLKLADVRRLPVFGVCLGLQAMVEYSGGALETLDYPMHGKATCVDHCGGAVFSGIPARFQVGRYHSLIAASATLPDCYNVTAVTDDDIVMAIEHVSRPWAAVQFHPESILTSPHDVGLPLLRNILQNLT